MADTPAFDPTKPFQTLSPQFDHAAPYTLGQMVAGNAGPAPPDTSAMAYVNAPAAGFNRGVAGVLGFPGDAINYLNTKKNEGINALAHTLGAKKDWIPNPASHGLPIGTPAIESLDPSGFGLNPDGTAKPQTAAQRWEGTVGGFAPAMLIPGSEMTWPQKIRMTVAGGTGSDVAQEVVPDKFKPLAGLIGSVFGGITPSATAKVAASAEPDIARTLDSMTAFRSDPAAARQAVGQFRSAATDEPSLLPKIENNVGQIVTGSEPTTFQQTGDMGIGSLERRQQTLNPVPFLDRRASQNAARTSVLRNVETGGDPVDVVNMFKQHLSDVDAGLAEQEQNATQAAQAATQNIGGGLAPADYGAQLRDHLQTARDNANASTNAMWRLVDPDRNLTVQSAPMVKAANSIQTEMSPSASPLLPSEKAILDTAANYKQQIPFAELNDMRGWINESLADARRSGGLQTVRRLSIMRDAVENSIGATVQNQVAKTPSLAQTLQEERDAWLARSNARSGDAGLTGTGQTAFSSVPGGEVPFSGQSGSLAGDQGLSNNSQAVVTDSAGKEYSIRGEPLPARGLSPANIRQDGSVYVGPRGSQHFQIAEATPTNPNNGWTGFGFVTPAGQYLTREEALAWVRNNEHELRPSMTMPTELDALDYRDQVPLPHIDAAQPKKPQPFNADAAQQLAQAKDSTRALHQTYDEGAIGRILQSSGFKGNYRLPDGSVAGNIFSPGPNGAANVQQFRAAVGDPAAHTVLRDAVATQMQRDVLTSDGVVDPGKLAAFSKKYESALGEFPDLQTQMTNASNASQLMADASAARQSAVAAYQKGIAGHFLGLSNPDDVTRTIGGMFNSKNSVGQISALVNAARPYPNATLGIRQAVVDYMTKKFISNTEAATSGENLISANAFQTFLKNNQGPLARVFKPDELQSINAVAQDLARSKRSETALQLPARSNTAQDMAAARAGQVSPGAAVSRRVGMDTLAGLVGYMTSGPGGGVVAFAARDAAGNLINTLRNAGIQRSDDLVREMLLNPQFAKEMLKKYPSQIPKQVPLQVRNALISSGVGTFQNLTQRPDSQ